MERGGTRPSWVCRPRKSAWPTYSATSPPAIRSTKHPGTLTAPPGAGFAGNRAHPQALVFRVPREGLEAKVDQRVNVRVLELIDTGSGSRIELEGMRLPITHSKDVIQELT